MGFDILSLITLYRFRDTCYCIGPKQVKKCKWIALITALVILVVFSLLSFDGSQGMQFQEKYQWIRRKYLLSSWHR
jgi:NADH:ubiquinone oxidoreductase subunit 4 (subunit M)